MATGGADLLNTVVIGATGATGATGKCLVGSLVESKGKPWASRGIISVFILVIFNTDYNNNYKQFLSG